MQLPVLVLELKLAVDAASSPLSLLAALPFVFEVIALPCTAALLPCTAALLPCTAALLLCTAAVLCCVVSVCCVHCCCDPMLLCFRSPNFPSIYMVAVPLLVSTTCQQRGVEGGL